MDEFEKLQTMLARMAREGRQDAIDEIVDLMERELARRFLNFKDIDEVLQMARQRGDLSLIEDVVEIAKDELDRYIARADHTPIRPN